MKKLILKCVILALMVESLLYLGGQAYGRTPEYASALSETKKFSGMSPSIDVAVFGNSHARNAFLSAPDGLTLFNFSMGHQTPQYDAALLRQYQKHLHPGSLVVINVGYSSPFCKQSDAAFEGYQERYYQILDFKNMVRGDAAHYYLRKLSLLLTTDSQKVYDALRTASAAASSSAAPAPASSSHPFSREELMEYANGREIADSRTFFPGVNPEMMDAYREMLTLCRENGWEAVLVSVPHLSMYNDCLTAFQEDFFLVYENAALGLSEEFKVPWMDYSHDSAYAGREDYFSDDREHMSLSGAEAFGRRFFSDIQALGFLDIR